MIVLIDNYDSFTWNLYHFLGDLGCKTEVYRNDKISVTDVIKLKPSQIVISPGPCDPNSAGISMSLVNAAIKNDIPLLGVCLGHQSIAQALGGEVIRCHEIIHGKTDNIINEGFPSYTTAAGWLGYSDEKMIKLTKKYLSEGWTHFKMKVGQDIERDFHRCNILRNTIGENNFLMIDANQIWSVNESIENINYLKK